MPTEDVPYGKLRLPEPMFLSHDGPLHPDAEVIQHTEQGM